jgi:glyoxylase-like metal-dependent hydrolase (beta-lactamase superfamily II)
MKSKKSKQKVNGSLSNSVGAPKTKPPDPSELELSVFGPGKGECLVVHLGSGEWMIVDSCLNEQGTKPIALEYLESLGVDASKQVKLVLVTHWHDDHIRGVGDIVREASAARFACSAAVKTPAFFSLLDANCTFREDLSSCRFLNQEA